MLVLTRINRA